MILVVEATSEQEAALSGAGGRRNAGLVEDVECRINSDEDQKDSYSDTGRPSIDPELLLRILLIGYLYGVTSERKLVEELQMHLAWRWFTGRTFHP